MICPSCRVAGDFTAHGALNMAEKFHVECDGDCTCQHRTEGVWLASKKKAPTPKREG